MQLLHDISLMDDGICRVVHAAKTSMKRVQELEVAQEAALASLKSSEENLAAARAETESAKAALKEAEGRLADREARLKKRKAKADSLARRLDEEEKRSAEADKRVRAEWTTVAQLEAQLKESKWP